jgi:hypothetical protein
VASIEYVVERETPDGAWEERGSEDHLRDALAMMHRESDLTRSKHRVVAREVIAMSNGMPPAF